MTGDEVSSHPGTLTERRNMRFPTITENSENQKGDRNMREITMEEFSSLLSSFCYEIEDDDVGAVNQFRRFVKYHEDGLCGIDGSDSMVAPLFDSEAEWSSELAATIPISEVLEHYGYNADHLNRFDYDDIWLLTRQSGFDLTEDVYAHVKYKVVAVLYMIDQHPMIFSAVCVFLGPGGFELPGFFMFGVVKMTELDIMCCNGRRRRYYFEG